jgi:hypothetical protein
MVRRDLLTAIAADGTSGSKALAASNVQLPILLHKLLAGMQLQLGRLMQAADEDEHASAFCITVSITPRKERYAFPLCTPSTFAHTTT